MTHTYRFHAQPAVSLGPYGPRPTLTPEALAQAIAGVTVRHFTASAMGGYSVDLQLDNQSHQGALDAIAAGLQQFGFNYGQAIVTEWATAVLEGAIVGGTGGGAVGSTTKDAGVALLSAVIGLAVGAAVGSMVQTAKATYQADRLHPFAGGWKLTALPPAGPASGTSPTWSPRT